MKTPTIYLLIFLLLSSCATTRRCSETPEYIQDRPGVYVLKNMSEEQVRRLAEEAGTSFERLMEDRAVGNEFARY